jgi:peptidoglycan hydrolase CwlO-like protein
MFGWAGYVIAQTVTPEQVALLQGSVQQWNSQMQSDETAIALDNADIQAKQADIDLMNRQIVAAQQFFASLNAVHTIGNTTEGVNWNDLSQ